MNKHIDISAVTIKTDRLLLRPWKETDLEDFYAYASVEGVGEMAGWRHHQSREESRRILNHFIGGKHTFALEYAGRVIGSLGIEKYNEANYPELNELKGCEIGYVLAKDHWGKGMMPEAVKAVIDYLFDFENLDFIICGHFDHNHRSARVIEKCGFQYIKTCPYETRYDTIETSLEYIIYHSEKEKQR